MSLATTSTGTVICSCAPAPAGAGAGRRAATYAVDVGGTWIRSRDLGTPGTPGQAVRSRTPSLLNEPGSAVGDLRARLVEHLARLAPPGAVVALSCGAALDETRGVVFGSAPLWGRESRPYDLLGALRRRRGDVEWCLVNDVTASLADFARTHAVSQTRHVGYLTVSSGIAYRQADWAAGTVAVDERGLQGEVGHGRAQVASGDVALLLARCECGRRGHLAALSSGPALERMGRAAGVVVEPAGTTESASAGGFGSVLAAGLAGQEPWAVSVLRSAVGPVAELIRTLWRLDPHLDLIGLGGGVVEGLGEFYRAELFDRLSHGDSYAEPDRDPAWLAEHLVLCSPGDVDPLAGAAALVGGLLRVVR